jgi:hypothetical protein
MGKVPAGEGLRAYYQAKIEELEIQIRDKSHNLRRMEAQRNELNTKGEPLPLVSSLILLGDGADPALCCTRPLQSECCGRNCSCCRSQDRT